jgi:Tol biopolymer transport system component
MTRRLLGIVALLLGPMTFAGAQAPESDVFLAPLRRVRDSLVVGKPVNVTHRPGYDNQPSFLPDSRGLLYTPVGADGQADIWRYDIAAHRTTRVTSTRESEYSATVMPGGLRMSVIRVEPDSTQRLWSFALDGSDPQVLLAEQKPVGYHAWLGAMRLATYVLGKPATLHVVDSDGAHDEVRAHDIGRALHRVPGREAFSYTQRDSSGSLWITVQPVSGGPETVLLKAAAGNEFHAWTPDGVLLSATEARLLRWNGALDSTRAWVPFADLSSAGLRNVSRLAVSPDGKWLAFVAEPVGH